MKEFLFRSKLVRASIVAGVLAFLPVSAAAASTNTHSTSLFATLQGTSVLGTEVPVLGTQGYTLTIPVGTQVPAALLNLLDFTVVSEVKVGNEEVLYLYVDPHMTD
jgi:hypothetical protein